MTEPVWHGSSNPNTKIQQFSAFPLLETQFSQELLFCFEFLSTAGHYSPRALQKRLQLIIGVWDRY
jgi:hypothetical protein